MKKYICISASMAAGVAICLWAPVSWRLIGVFCFGGGCYAIIESVKMLRIQREIERYEAPAAHLLPVRARTRHIPALAARKLITLLQRGRMTLSDALHSSVASGIVPTPAHAQRLRSAVRGAHHRAAVLARIFIITIKMPG